jgi:co-chaperonin GroES (HSP10)
MEISMENRSGLVPLGRAVLVEPYEPEIKQGLIHIPEAIKGKGAMVEQRAVVVEAGPVAWADEAVPRAKAGDKVLVSRYSGYMALGTADGKQYRFVNDKDIFAGIVEEKANGS